MFVSLRIHANLNLIKKIISSAQDRRTGTKVAIKKLLRPFQSELFAKRAYRELRLLKHMKHDNVSSLNICMPSLCTLLLYELAFLYFFLVGYWTAECFHRRPVTGPIPRLVSSALNQATSHVWPCLHGTLAPCIYFFFYLFWLHLVFLAWISRNSA